jgi:hypothetical protein
MNLKALKTTPSWNWPKVVDTIIRDALIDNSADVSERCLAAEMAGDYVVVNDDLIRLLLGILTSDDQPEALRATAAVALGPALEEAHTTGFGDIDDELISEETFAEVKSALRRLFEDTATPELVRRRALEAAVRAHEPWQREAVTDAFSDDSESWRLTAVFCMRFIKGFDDYILEALTSNNEDIHYQAVCAAGSFEVAEAWPHVLSIIKHPKEVDKPLLLAAIDAVASIRPKEASDALDALAHSDDEEISEAVLDAMSLAGEIEEDRYIEYKDEDYY